MTDTEHNKTQKSWLLLPGDIAHISGMPDDTLCYILQSVGNETTGQKTGYLYLPIRIIPHDGPWLKMDHNSSDKYHILSTDEVAQLRLFSGIQNAPLPNLNYAKASGNPRFVIEFRTDYLEVSPGQSAIPLAKNPGTELHVQFLEKAIREQIRQTHVQITRPDGTADIIYLQSPVATSARREHSTRSKMNIADITLADAEQLGLIEPTISQTLQRQGKIKRLSTAFKLATDNDPDKLRQIFDKACLTDIPYTQFHDAIKSSWHRFSTSVIEGDTEKYGDDIPLKFPHSEKIHFPFVQRIPDISIKDAEDNGYFECIYTPIILRDNHIHGLTAAFKLCNNPRQLKKAIANSGMTVHPSVLQADITAAYESFQEFISDSQNLPVDIQTHYIEPL